MRNHFLLGLAFTALVAGSAAAQDVKSDFDPSYNFAGMKTFVSKIQTSWGNQLGEARVIAAVDSALKSRGYTRVPDEKWESADVVVLIHGSSENKKDATTFYSGGTYGGWGGWRGGWTGGGGMATTTVNEYTVGTLVVDIFDIKSKKMVFRGTASDEISDKAEKNAKKVNKAMEKMFKADKFPPKSK